MSRRLLSCIAVICMALTVLFPAAARAALRFDPSGTALETVDAEGNIDDQAGLHPYALRQSFSLVNDGGSDEDPYEFEIELPAGTGGDAYAVPFCSKADAHRYAGAAFCPPESQIGTLTGGGRSKPIYNVAPGPNQVAEFMVPSTYPTLFPVAFVGRLRATDAGMTLRIGEIPSFYTEVAGAEIELWGVPADHQVGTSIPRRALLTMPTQCATPLITRFKLRTWQNPDRLVVQDGEPAPPRTGCAGVPFAPALGLDLGSPRADSPSGATIELKVPQNPDPGGIASSHLKDVDVLLPEGMTFSPGGAAGVVACTDAQLAQGTEADPACPDSSRVGTVELRASALGGEVISGGVYLGQERPGERFRFFVAVSVRGTPVKFSGSLKADPKTGQLTTSLHDLPQVPLDSMTLRFDGGPGALLATPLACGPAKTLATFVPGSGTGPVRSTATVTIAGAGGGACSGQLPFAPTFTGGTTSAAAREPTTFRSLVSRRDGEQLPARVEIGFPPGLSATLGAVDTCSEVASAQATCPASSRIGGAIAELGPGANPAQVNGDMFLTGPYRGQPFGLTMAFRGKIGSLDLGTMVVRGSMRIDPQTGELTAVIDSLPRVFEGVSVRFQSIGMRIDRPGFLVTPTSCAPSDIVSTIGSVTGQVSRSQTPFKVSGCVGLPFRPRFDVDLAGGRSRLQRGGKPGLVVTAKIGGKGANLRSADVSLPGPLRYDASAPTEICARRKAMEGECSERARVGSATAETTLLRNALKGGVYIAQPKGGGQPDIWTHLEGEGLSLDLRSSAASKDGRLHTRLQDLPDVPVSRLKISFDGGKHGLFKLERGLCRKGRTRALHGEVRSEGQNKASTRAALPVAARPGC